MTSTAVNLEQVLSFLPNDKEFIDCIQDIIENPVILEMNDYIQHGTTSCLTHCIDVAYKSYKAAKRFGFDYKSCARAGLLHDLFLYDWHDIDLTKLHGFTHPSMALKNANNNFDLNKVEKDIILKHMWPLTVIPPKHFEGFIIVWYDKICTITEFFKRFSLSVLKKQTKNKI